MWQFISAEASTVNKLSNIQTYSLQYDFWNINIPKDFKHSVQFGWATTFEMFPPRPTFRHNEIFSNHALSQHVWLQRNKKSEEEKAPHASFGYTLNTILHFVSVCVHVLNTCKCSRFEIMHNWHKRTETMSARVSKRTNTNDTTSHFSLALSLSLLLSLFATVLLAITVRR